MIKAQDFARERGVTDRQILRLIQKHEDELEGLFQRKGANGTWLTEEACNILKGYMKRAPIIIGDDETTQRVEALEAENSALKDKLIALHEEHGKTVLQLAEAQGAQKLLEASENERKELKAERDEYKDEVAQLRIELATTKAQLEAEQNKGFFERLFGKRGE